MATSWPIKFHTAAKPGMKRKSDNDAQNKNNEKHKANRNRLFLSCWATDRLWLQNEHEKGMTCKIGVEHYGDSLNLQGSGKKQLFIAGPKNYKISTVSDHEKSCVHIEGEIQSNSEGESASEENRDESDVDSDGEIDSESEFEQREDETFRNVNKFVEIEYEMEYN